LINKKIATGHLGRHKSNSPFGLFLPIGTSFPPGTKIEKNVYWDNMLGKMMLN
jgi:hypothetical protein